MLDLQSVYFGQHHPNFDHSDYELLQKLIRLAKKEWRQCENSCNGHGVVKGKMYYTGLSHGQLAGDYERREYGYSVQSAYLSNDAEETVFDNEIDNIREKIENLIKNTKFSCEFQGDPRGQTVKIFYNNSYINQ